MVTKRVKAETGVKFLIVISLVTLLLLYINPSKAISQEKEISITFSGDILPHTSLYEKNKNKNGYDFSETFKGISPLLEGDINLCHLETVLSKNKPSSYPIFSSPIELADAIKLSWEGCSGASNHTLDKGIKGVISTKKIFQKLNLPLAGTKISPQDDPISYYNLPDGHTLAYLAYTYGTNGIKVPKENPEIVNIISYSKIKKSILEAATKADLIILYLHWGNEYQENPSTQQRVLANKLLALPELNAIVGSHVHVLQPAEIINSKPVAYGLGNLWSGQGPWSGQPKGQIGAILKLNFTYNQEKKRYEYTKGEINPTITLSSNWRVFPALNLLKTNQHTSACLALSSTKRLYEKVFSTPKTC